MGKAAFYALVTIWLIKVLGVWAGAGWDQVREQKEKALIEENIAKFKRTDTSVKVFFDKAQGYVVFPSIGKGGFSDSRVRPKVAI